MAWETRQRGGRYYTRSRREGGQIVREYVGCGAVAELMAELDALDKQQAALEREQEQAQRIQGEAVFSALDPLTLLTEVVLHQTLTAAGYHRHH